MSCLILGSWISFNISTVINNHNYLIYCCFCNDHELDSPPKSLPMVVNLQKEVLGMNQWLGRKRRICATVAGAKRCVVVSGETARFFQFSFMIEPACTLINLTNLNLSDCLVHEISIEE
jgi:hypothetical protein